MQEHTLFVPSDEDDRCFAGHTRRAFVRSFRNYHEAGEVDTLIRDLASDHDQSTELRGFFARNRSLAWVAISMDPLHGQGRIRKRQHLAACQAREKLAALR